MADLDPVKNFAFVEVSGSFLVGASTITLVSGGAAKLPVPATDGAFNLSLWNETDFPNPAEANAANVEIVRVTSISGEVLTITRAQESTTAIASTAGKTYKMLLGPTKKLITDIQTEPVNIIQFESDIDVAVGNGTKAFTIPASMDGMNLSDVVASVHTKGIDANSFRVLVIGGGGGGATAGTGGGGGAGGYKEEAALTISSGTSYAITVGAGGTGGGASVFKGTDGEDSSIGAILVSEGGGAGGAVYAVVGNDGGSGGGGGGSAGGGAGGAGGAASAGYAGGVGFGADVSSSRSGGGGGGAGVVGEDGVFQVGGDGGNGLSSDITGSSVTRGGGGGADSGPDATAGGSGGSGGGGDGDGANNIPPAQDGTPNTGGGAGAGPAATGAEGGSGVVIIRFATADISITDSTGASSTTDGSDTILTWNASGTFEFTNTTPPTTDIQIRRRRAGSDIDMLSTKLTIGDEFFASDEVVNRASNFRVLVIAGGGGGAGGEVSGGGGAGGYQEDASFGIYSNISHTITVGAGGAGGTTTPFLGSNGDDSSIGALLVSTGGGRGGSSESVDGASGGSGGGGSGYASPGYEGSGGAGTQGNDGGDGIGGAGTSTMAGGGGGGKNAAGSDATASNGGAGGNGLSSDITGAAVTRAGGGGGADSDNDGGLGGAGGGGNGGDGTTAAASGTANTGGGGGSASTSGSGGSGVVIIRFATADISVTDSTGASSTTDGSDTILTWNSSGTFKFLVIDDEMETGDQFYVDVDAVHTIAAKGLFTTLTFKQP